MRPIKAVASIMKNEPVNVDERIERLELETNRKLQQFEEALGVFKDIVVKLYDEKEQLAVENVSLKNSITDAASQVKDSIIKPITDAGEGFVELLMENENKPGNQIIGTSGSIGFNPNTNEMDRTIKWMRERFGLSPSAEAKARKKKKK